MFQLIAITKSKIIFIGTFNIFEIKFSNLSKVVLPNKGDEMPKITYKS